TGERVALTENAFGDPVRSTEWGIKNYVEGGAYVGILPLVLVGIAGIAAVVRPEPGSPGPLFAVLGVLSLSFVFGTPTYALLYYGLPFINQSHSPFRWVWPLTLCLAVLAGIGAQALNRLPPKTIRWLAALCLAAGALVIGGVVVSRIAYPADLVQRTFEGLALAANAFPDGRAFYSYQVRNAAILAVMLLGSGGVLLLAAARITVREVPAWWIAAPALLIVDMALAYGGLYPANDPALLDVQPESIAWLADHYDPLDPWRYIAYEEPGADTINSNIGWLHGLEDAAGYDSLLLGSYADFMRVIQPQGDLLYNRIAPLYTAHPDSLVSPALDLLGVRYVITVTTIDLPPYNPVYSDEAVTIYENVDAYPRAFTVPQSATVFYEGDIQEAARSYDVRTTVLIKVFPPAVHTPPEDFRGEATLTVNTPADTWIDVNVSDPAWLIVTENAYPGWRAFVRPLGAGDAAEVEAKVVQVNGTFQGVRLAEGRWTVRLSYSPNSVWLGGFVSFMAGIGLVFALGVYAWRYFYRESEEGSAARRVAKNAITPIVLNLFNRGIQFAFAIVYLRLLGPVGAGQYTYAVLIFGWFDILSNFGLDTLLMREVARDKEAANRWLVNTTIIRLAIAVLGIPLLVAFIAARNALGDSPLPAVTVTAIWLLYIGLFISTVNKGLTGLFYAYEKAEYPAATQTISTMLVASLGMIALLLGTGIVGLAAVSIIVNAITLALLGWLTLQQFFVPRPTFDWQLQRSAMGESFPLMINHLLATLFFRIDVILLELLTTAQVVGWYGVVYKWIDAINVIPAFFTQALFPVMSRQAAEDRALLKRSYVFSVKLLTLLSLPTAVITTLLAPLLIGILAGAAFLPYSAIALQIFVWSIPLGWINSVTNYVIIALDRQRILTWAFVFGAGFNVAGNLILIPRYNFPAAAAMTILSEFVLLAFFYMVLLAPLGRINWVGALWRIAVPAGAMGAAAWLLAPLNVWVALGTSLVVYAALIWILRPFTPFEQQQLTDLLPERLRRTVSC
ncbi:MAG: flippase, partial [Chloroflexi bacterium]|nr:flippase [Chloroflexota bacterium]